MSSPGRYDPVLSQLFPVPDSTDSMADQVVMKKLQYFEQAKRKKKGEKLRERRASDWFWPLPKVGTGDDDGRRRHRYDISGGGILMEFAVKSWMIRLA